jgi:membrane protease YdiL (CAAX protease family)
VSDAPSPRPEPDPSPAVAPTSQSEADGRGRDLLRLAVPFYGIVALFALGYALFTNQITLLFGEQMPTLAHLAAGLGVGLALVGLTRALTRSWAPMTRMADGLSDLLGPIAWHWGLLLALLSGFAEELLFRGALWPTLGLIGTTLLFGLLHVLPRRRLWLYPVFAIVAGLLLGLLREGTQSLWPAILAHVTVNALNLAWIGSRARRRAAGPPADGPPPPQAPDS